MNLVSLPVALLQQQCAHLGSGPTLIFIAIIIVYSTHTLYKIIKKYTLTCFATVLIITQNVLTILMPVTPSGA